MAAPRADDADEAEAEAKNWAGLHDPVAGRSCRLKPKQPGLGGDWYEVDSSVGLSVEEDRASLFHSLPEDEQALLEAEMDDLIDQAELGKLVYEGRRCGLDDVHVKRMQLDDRVLELVVGTRVDQDLRQVQTRIYFTEPSGHDRMLLMLHVNAKFPSHRWKSEQNAHINNAARRLDSHRW